MKLLKLALAATVAAVIAAPAAIAQEIEDDIDFLTTNVRNLPARHRSLRAVFDHSWQLLSAEEQAVLPQLAVFRSGFRPAEARAVTGASQVLLATLVDKSLLAVAADGRYDLHERLGQYLLDKLRQDLSLYQAANDRHSLAYLNLLQLDPTEPYRQTTLQRLSEDVDNLRAAWHWAGDHDHWSALRRARRGLHLFCLVRQCHIDRRRADIRENESPSARRYIKVLPCSAGAKCVSACDCRDV